MKKLCTLFSLCLLLSAAVALTARAQGNTKVVGNWEMTTVTPMGERKGTLVISEENGKLIAKAKSPQGERSYDSITVNGSDITLVLTIQFGGNDMVITYKGKIEGGAMKGDADFGGLASGEWSAVMQKEGAMAASSMPAASAGAVNVTGTWQFTVETPQGSGSPVFTFKQEGEKLSGSYKGQFGEGPVNGTVTGNDIKFSVKVNAQGQEVEIVYTGKVESKDAMKGTAKLGDFGEATWMAKKQ